MFGEMHRKENDGIWIDDFTVTTMLKLSAKCQQLHGVMVKTGNDANAFYGQQLHGVMVKTGNDATKFSLSSLIHMYSKCGKFKEVCFGCAKSEIMPQRRSLNMCHPDGTPWVANLIMGDTITNLQNLADEHPDVGHALRASRVNFLTESDTRLLFVKASQGHLPISPTTPGINQEGLFFVVSHAYSDGSHYEILNKGRYTQSGRPFGEFNFTEANLKDKRSNLSYTRRNIRLRHQFNILACIHYLRVHENPHAKVIAEKRNHIEADSHEVSSANNFIYQ
ncbi:PREDICTED: uncharacterized protein LOC109130808 [Camelina sativa]|uniref:Uncharacterized protein LOC109130808 n=1 Tax=Camelina sativa TaxID=90675 RepID=A0ABM1RBL7_CAMSA|nr:PREDICTED: uncharacterized protein LOC109130808 [Camelina sativa]